MSNKLKSAYELALESVTKADPMKDLTNSQKTAIEELRKMYMAKIAERKIMFQKDLSELNKTGNTPDYHLKRNQIEESLAGEIRALESEMEQKIKDIRKKHE
ncbi:hypothetical protein JW979_05800 [bacterium]|nr:hypothetical protein [candidate division CSSED10-310 bacterium]